MKLTRALRGDSLGVKLEVPREWQVIGESEEALQLIDEASQVQWWLFWFPGMHLALGQGGGQGATDEDAQIEAAMRHYARAMFEWAFHHRARNEAGSEGGSDGGSGKPGGGDAGKAGGKPAGEAKREPRTADPTWTPMVDYERLQAGGAPALRTVHRMSYEPGREIVMGHLLIPLKSGLFEVRVAAGDPMTGVREAMLLAMRRDPDATKPLTQREIDAPEHDEKFRDHALSRVRRALRWALAEAKLEVTAPAAVHQHGEVVLKKLDCALTPPPRFVRQVDHDDYNLEVFQRVGFCGTDGVERLLVQRVYELGKLAPAQLRAAAEKYSRQLNEKSEVRDLALTTEEVALGERRAVLVEVCGQGHDGGLRNSFCWVLDRKGTAHLIAILGSDAVPASERRDELLAAATSWRSTRDARPWWRPW